MSRSEREGETDTVRELLEQALSGAYHVERELGGGGMARVFLAEERALGRQVVVKVLAPELAHALSAERFAREVKLSARLQHPNIVPVLAAGAVADVPYYTMPFIKGESLRARLDRLGEGERLPIGHAMDILRDVARALAYAHSAGVVHRDIKPDNVLLAYDAAVVADFGIAKAVQVARAEAPDGRSTTLTQAGIAVGTPAYMAPEQAAGDAGVDHRVDVYAWGIVAYELLAGVHPFADRQSVQALVLAHLTEHPRRIEELAPRVPPAISALVMRCLAKDPAGRPASAREIADALPTAITEAQPGPNASVPASVPVGGTTPPLPRATHQRPRWFTAGIGAVLVVAGASIVYAVLQAPSQVSGLPDASNRSGVATTTSAAYDAYLRGKVRSRNENLADNDTAIAALREAIGLDPSFAPAYAELSRVLTIRGFYFAPESEKRQVGLDAEVTMEKALALDPKLAAGHFARGFLLWTPGRRFPHEQSIQAYRRALALDPAMDEAHHQLALVYLHIGLFEHAWAHIDSALALNPGNTLARFRYGVIDLYRGEFERAYRIFNSTALDQNPSLWAFQAATALFRLGREAEAMALIDRFLADHPTDEGGVGTSVRAMIHAKAGRRREAEAAMARAIELGRNFGHFHHTAYNIASAYALLGDREQAIRLLEDAADNGFPCYPLFATDVQLDGLRKDPRFIALLARLERDWEERKRRL
jgi:serine/threonine protein kinase/Flp pilus assembly protein TadD